MPQGIKPRLHMEAAAWRWTDGSMETDRQRGGEEEGGRREREGEEGEREGSRINK